MNKLGKHSLVLCGGAAKIADTWNCFCFIHRSEVRYFQAEIKFPDWHSLKNQLSLYPSRYFKMRLFLGIEFWRRIIHDSILGGIACNFLFTDQLVGEIWSSKTRMVTYQFCRGSICWFSGGYQIFTWHSMKYQGIIWGKHNYRLFNFPLQVCVNNFLYLRSWW